MAFKKISGVYCIEHISSQRKYVGSSVCMRSRLAVHKSTLLLNRHHNKYLQSVFDKYGLMEFLFYFLEECSVEALQQVEKEWIDKLNTTDRTKGFNASNDTTCAARGRKQSKEEIEKRKAAIRKIHIFVDPNGIKVTVDNLKQFAKDNGFRYEGIEAVSSGNRQSHKGWRNYKPELDGVPFTKRKMFDGKKHQKAFSFISPLGEQIDIIGLSQFCRRNDLRISDMHALYIGKRKSNYKGWSRCQPQ